MCDFLIPMTGFQASADVYFSSISSKILVDLMKLAIYMKNEPWLLTKKSVLISVKRHLFHVAKYSGYRSLIG